MFQQKTYAWLVLPQSLKWVLGNKIQQEHSTTTFFYFYILWVQMRVEVYDI